MKYLDEVIKEMENLEELNLNLVFFIFLIIRNKAMK